MSAGLSGGFRASSRASGALQPLLEEDGLLASGLMAPDPPAGSPPPAEEDGPPAPGPTASGLLAGSPPLAEEDGAWGPGPTAPGSSAGRLPLAEEAGVLGCHRSVEEDAVLSSKWT